MGHQALASIADIEQKLQEQSSAVKQLMSVSQDCSCRVEEHEFRLGVARTKMDVHDEKISRLEARRWTQCPGSASSTDKDRAIPSSTNPTASPRSWSHRDTPGDSSSSATSTADVWQMKANEHLAFGAWA